MKAEQMEQARQLLQEIYGYDSFRPGQEQVIQQVLERIDTLAVMPTGGGKSLCYQLPALLLEGVTLVISPLISLMKDQVDALRALGIKGSYINSTLARQDVTDRLNAVSAGDIDLLYVAPERLGDERLRRALMQAGLAFVAVDEAHCLSQWGHDFRPSYKEIPAWIYSFQPAPSVLALTATATPSVAEELRNAFDIAPDHSVETGFARDNLTFHVVKGADKATYIDQYVKRRQQEAGIVYTATRKEAEALQKSLQRKGVQVGLYHGGLSEEERRKNQEDFLYDECQVMVATNAFGMGINKSNVRFVIHASMPGSVEAYYQEAGRAGRDGAPAECLLLFSAQDVRTQRFFIEQSDAPQDRIEALYGMLQDMTGYCHTDGCLVENVLSYFGEQDVSACGRCGNCTREGERMDRTEDAQKVLSCVLRMRENYGKTMIAQVLTGSRNQKVLQFKLHTVSTYGLMKGTSAKIVQGFIEFLLAEQYVRLTLDEFPKVKVTPKGAEVLRGERRVEQFIEASRPAEVSDKLFEVLRACRKRLAQEEGLPPFMIFSDKTLRDMCDKQPHSMDAMLDVSGIGQMKLEKYGEAFLEALQQEESTAN
ncbi:DNA helicase RecQ [Aureibacillus halotolerans]|uniref:DNA helicase RecQ n=1 Tax=Aureibacillus halotolerans TaxID=1508390 RepID=A0A4R6UD23_9BACI|nr:DNA helicase RecQ [Aureibacillus halotolerans]TDQ42665.1 RecQ-like ATP-dependent DNA helicase [Aureibacillus halotolerans]